MKHLLRTGGRAVLGLVAAAAISACEGDNIFPSFGISGSPTDAGTGTIEGSVTSAAAPLGGVTIDLLSPLRDSTVTNSLGEYQFAELPASTYDVSIRVPLNFALAPGDSALRRVRLAANGVERVNWQLIAQGPVP